MDWLCTFLIVGSDLHHGGGAVGAAAGLAVGAADPGVAAENMCPAVLAAQNGPLVEDRRAAQCHGTVAAHNGIGQDLIVEGDVDAVMVPVEGHRLHFDIRIDQLRAARLHAGGGVQNGLGTFG